jgi:hypothetical protein
MVAGAAFLLVNYLKRAKEGAAESGRSGRFRAIEVLSWVAVATFLFFISSFNLMTSLERAGAVSIAFLAGALIFLPVAIRRTTAIERRLARLPKGVTVGLLIVMLATASLFAAIAWVRPPGFI